MSGRARLLAIIGLLLAAAPVRAGLLPGHVELYSHVDALETYQKQFYKTRAFPGTRIPSWAKTPGQLRMEAREAASKRSSATHVPSPLTPTSSIRFEAIQPSSVAYPGFPPTFGPTWTSIGPDVIPNGQLDNTGTLTGPVTGRITAVAPDYTNSNVCFIGAAQGGVWKTTDGGTTWTPLTDNQDSLAIGAMALDPKNPNVVYACTGEENGSVDSYYGVGILKSTDGGKTWKLQANSTFNRMTIGSITIDPNSYNPLDPTDNVSECEHLWVGTGSGSTMSSTLGGGPVSGTSENWIYKSTDAGRTFAVLALPNVVGTLINCPTVVVDPTDTSGPGGTSQTLVAGYVGQKLVNGVSTRFGDIFHTKTGGVASSDWTTATTGLTIAGSCRTTLAISTVPALRLVVAADDGSGGNAFIADYLPGKPPKWSKFVGSVSGFCSTQCSYDQPIAISPVDSNNIVVGGMSNVYFSNNGGATFTDTSQAFNPVHADIHAIAFQGDPALGAPVWLGCDGGIWKSISGGLQWINENNGNLAITQFQSISLHPIDPTIIIGGTQDNGSLARSGATSWTSIAGGNGGIAHIDPANPTTYYHSFSTGETPNVERSDDSGKTWKCKVTNDTKATGCWINTDIESFYAPLVTDPVTSTTLYYGTEALYRSIKRGDEIPWQAISPPLVGGSDYFTAIAPSAADPKDKTLYIGSTEGRVFYTGDLAFWTEISPVIGLSITDIVADTASVTTAYLSLSGFSGVVGGGGIPTEHVWKTTNAGGSWTDISGSDLTNYIPDVPVNKLALVKRDQNGAALKTPALLAATDLGVFTTFDGAATWHYAANGFPSVTVTDLQYNLVNNVAVAATHGRSCWSVPLLDSITTGTPAANERLIPGSTFNVTWSAMNGIAGAPIAVNPSTSFIIELSTDGGVTFGVPFAFLSEPTTPNTVTAYSYSWTVPCSPQTLKARLRFYALDASGNAVATTTSPADFTINSRPIANAGPSQRVTPSATVTLDGTRSTDPDALPPCSSAVTLGYSWTKVSGPAVTFVPNPPTVAKPTFTAPLARGAVDVFSLTVNDGLESSATSSNTTVTVNQLPIANAGPDQGVTPGKVTLDGSASSDSDGDSLGFKWTLLSVTGPGPVPTLYSSTTVNPTFTAASGNVYSITLNVTDGLEWSTNLATVNVSCDGGVLTANAGPSQNVTPGAIVTLDGSGSNDTDLDPITYRWTQTAGPAVTLSAGTTANPTFTAAMTRGTLVVFRLGVSDGLFTRTANTSVTVNEVPVARTGPDQHVAPSTNVTLDARTSSDPDGDTLTYAWVQTAGGTPAVLSSSTAVTPTFISSPTHGTTYSFKVTVSDGLETASTTTNVTVNQLPVAVSGPDQNVLPGTVTLDGSRSSDPDGDILTYTWTQTGGAPLPGFPKIGVGAAGDKPTFTATQSTTASFQLVVNDGFENCATPATVNVTCDANRPIASAGTNQIVLPSAIVTLNGTASGDPDGNPLTYTWTQVSGPAVTLSSFPAPLPTFNITSTRGACDVFDLSVFDGYEHSATATTSVTVNRLPIANAGPDKQLNPGIVTLDGSKSFDPDGQGITYVWTQTVGNPVTLSPSNAVAKPTFVATANNTYTFQLVVNDSMEPSASPATVNITCSIPIVTANAGPNQTVKPGVTVKLTGAASSDSNNNPLTYSWAQTFGPVVTLSPSTTAVTPTFAIPTGITRGTTYTFKLTVTDSTFPPATSTANVTITVNQLPIVKLGAPARVIQGSIVTLDASGTRDPDGDTLVYTWTQPGGPPVTLYNVTTVNPTFTATPPTGSTLSFQVTARDSIESASATTSVFINVPPTCAAGPDQHVLPDALVTLAGSASDSDKDALTYAWTLTSGPAVTLSSPTATHPTFTASNTRGSVYAFRLDASDGLQTSSSTTNVTVNSLPTVNAGANQRVTPGTVVTLDGSASSDTDGDALTYSWTQTGGSPMVTLSSATAPQPTFTAPSSLGAAFTFKLTVNDGLESAIGITVVDDCPTGTLAASPASLSFVANADGSAPPAQGIFLSASGSQCAQQVTITVLTASGGAWLSTSLSQSFLPVTVNASVAPGGLAAGTYDGQVIISGSGTSNSPLIIPVTFQVPGQTLGEKKLGGGCNAVHASRQGGTTSQAPLPWMQCPLALLFLALALRRRAVDDEAVRGQTRLP